VEAAVFYVIENNHTPWARPWRFQRGVGFLFSKRGASFVFPADRDGMDVEAVLAAGLNVRILPRATPYHPEMRPTASPFHVDPAQYRSKES